MRAKGYLLILGLITFFLIAFNLPLSAVRRFKAGTREAIAPYQDMLLTGLRRSRTYLAAVTRTRGMVAENRRLSDELAQLRHEVRDLRRGQQENAELRSMLGFVSRTPHRLVPADVIARGEVSGWWQTVRLNRGRLHGVDTNLAVVTGEGLVGRTLGVSAHSTDVLLITDPNSRVACRLPRPGVFGILQGGGVSLTGRPSLEMLCAPAPAQLGYVAKDANLLPGDEVVTSGLGGVFPRDLVVGYLVKAAPDPSGLHQRADVTPAADLRRLTRAYVVLDGK